MHIRKFLLDGPLSKIAAENPNVEFNVFLRRGKHPYLKAEYGTLSSCDVDPIIGTVPLSHSLTHSPTHLLMLLPM